MNPNTAQAPQPVVAEENDQLVADRSILSVGSSEGQTVQYFFRLAKKYIWLVLTCALLGAGSGIIKNMTSPKEYQASALIEITADTAERFGLNSTDYDSGYIDVGRLDTEIAILKSSTLALQTITALDLQDNKDFLPEGSPRPWDISNIHIRHALIGMFQGGLSAERYGHTNILQLTCTSRSPELAAIICNSLIKNYVQHNFTDNYEAAHDVSVWLQNQLGDLKKDLEASQEHLLSVQRDIGVVGIDQTQSIVLSRLVALENSVTQAETERLMAQARLVTLKSSPAIALPTLSSDPILLSLKERMTEMQSTYANENALYGSKNPRLVQIRAEMAEIQQNMAQESKTVITRAQQEVNGAVQNENALSGRLQEEENKAYSGSSKAVEYGLARREYESKRALYDGLEQRLQEAGIIAGLQSTDIRKIDMADAPDFPSSPRKSRNLMLATAAGLAIGLVLAFVIESLDTNIKSIYDIEERLGLPMLGLVPKVDTKQLSPEAFIADATSSVPGSWSRLAESYRSLRTTILLSRAGAPPQVILISSAKPSEGKTSISTLESVVFALNGARVILIDADLRRPSVHLRFRIGNKIGLTSVLTGKSSVEEAVVPAPGVPTLHILPAGPIAPMPAELLGSQQMQKLVEEMRSSYDFILIDTPPVLTVTDAAVLVSVSDGAVLVLRYAEASRNVVARGSEILLRSGAHLLGVVLNAVDLRSSDYAEYYGRAYNDYYQNRVDAEE